jgi:alpha-beta hydrolase superfamily lysophospholipase
MTHLRRRFPVVIAVVLATLVSITAAFASDTLPRRGLLGVSTADAKGGGVSVLGVLPSLPGEAAGIKPGDVITSVDGTPVANTAAFLSKLRRPGGRPVVLGIARGGTALELRAVLAEASKEHDPAVDTRYDSLEIDHSLRRTLVTAPHGATGKHPAVLIVGGIGCYSVDIASNAEDPYMRLTHDLSRRGFVTMRLEKSGVGDSQGPPCSTVDYTAEAASYGVAFDALRREPLVDPAHVYVFGHSIGSIIGPRLAAEKHAAGVVVAEGVARPWIEYELENSRRQAVLGGKTPAEVDTALLLKEACMHRLLVEKQPKSALLRDTPACADYTQYPAPDAYFQEIAPLNMAEPWTVLTVPVLAIYGTADFVTDERDHQRIVDIVNAAHPGNARLTVIAGMDHNLTPAGSQRASFDRTVKGNGAPATYDPRFTAAVAGWLCERERCTSPGG